MPNHFQNTIIIVIVFLIVSEVTDFSIYLIFKFKQYKNVNIANVVYYGKTRLFDGLFTIASIELSQNSPPIRFRIPQHQETVCNKMLGLISSTCDEIT